jgi:predicted PurR-regulated permease PerM
MHEVTARIDIPTRTIVKVVLVLATLWFLARIGPVLQQIFAGLLLAMSLYPPVARLQQRGMPKGRAIASVFGTVVAVITLALAFLVPQWIEEGQAFVDDLPGYVEDGTTWLRDNIPWLHDRLVEAAGGSEQDVTGEAGTVDTESAISVGQRVASFFSTAFVALVLAVYFLLEGDRAFNWLARDLRSETVRRMRRAAPELSRVISSYVAHQIQTSVLCGLYTFVVLAVLDVPSAMILATITAIADAVPLIGVVLAIVPAVIVALTQGWETALLVLALFLAYQAFENWVLIPRIFGRSLQLSSFGMLMAVLIGWQLAGLIGVLIALPTAAALLVIERIWLAEDPDADIVSEADAPGPAAAVAVAVELASDLAGGDEPEADEPSTEKPEDVRPESIAQDPAATPPDRPAESGKGRRGGRRARAEQAAPDTAPS